MSIALRILVCATGVVLICMARKANIVRKLSERTKHILDICGCYYYFIWLNSTAGIFYFKFVFC